MRLGLAPHDPVEIARAPSLAAHRFAAMAPPPILNRNMVDFTPGLYRNDVLPDCTAAGLANAMGMVAALNGFTIAENPDAIPAFYARCVGCENTDAAMIATDGAVALDVLKLQLTTGFDVGQQIPMVGKFGTLPKSKSVIASAINTFGHSYMGVSLRERDMERAPLWDVVEGRDDGAVVGGHLIVGWDYLALSDEAPLRVATWGGWQSATWAWLLARLNEAYALVWRQLAGPSGISLSIDYATLEADLAAYMA